MHRGPGPIASDAIINLDLLLQAIAGVREFRAVLGQRAMPFAPIDCEPVLQEFLQGSLLEIAGKMGLSGCSPEIISNVHQETSFLLNVTFEAVGQAHRRLFSDLLPDSAANRPPRECPDCESEDEGEGEDSGEL